MLKTSIGNITADQVRELREKTGLGIMKCKDALIQTQGDMEAAIALLRLQEPVVRSRDTDEGVIGVYSHMGGKVVGVVEVNCETDFVARTDQFQELSRHLAMQVVAICPKYIDRKHIPESVIAQKTSLLTEGLLDKPEAIRDRIVEGKLRKYMKEVCLLQQPYIKDDTMTVQEYIGTVVMLLGETITVKRFARYEVGE